MAVLGSEDEVQVKAKADVKREQKKLRGGKTAKAPGLAGGQRVVDTTEESLREFEVIQSKLQESQNIQLQDQTPKTSTIKKSKVRSKAYQAAKAKVNPNQQYSLPDAIKLLRDISYTKTNNTVELHITLKEKGLATEVELPHSTGPARRVAIADETTLAKIAAGKIDFDVLVASPADMPKLVKYAKILGPKGLMPNPKSATLVANPQETAQKLSSSNAISLKTEKDTPVIHTVAGKLTMADDQLGQNITAILASLPAGQKTAKVVLKSTMSPAIKLQV